MTINITDASKSLFIALAHDAGNWGGTPCFGCNVGSKAERGNLTQLKRAGLVTSQQEEGAHWVYFTAAGKEYAAQFGVEI